MLPNDKHTRSMGIDASEATFRFYLYELQMHKPPRCSMDMTAHEAIGAP